MGEHQPPIEIQQINPQEILFSIATIAEADFSLVIPTEEDFHLAPKFHEDEWLQLEFLPATSLPTIKNKLKEFKAFEQKNRTVAGWRDIYVRKSEPQTVLANSGNTSAIDKLAKTVNGEVLPAPILTTTSEYLGQVASGFTIKVDDDVLLYGTYDESGIVSLAGLLTGDNGHQSLTQTFMTLSKTYGMVLVDWRGQQVLIETLEDGQIDAWNP